RSSIAASIEAVNYSERPCAVAFRRHFENGSATGIEEIARTLRASRGGSIQASFGIEDQTAMAGITAIAAGGEGVQQVVGPGAVAIRGELEDDAGVGSAPESSR